jgi:hypothetical protein
MYGNFRLSGEGLLCLAVRLPNLRYLNIAHTQIRGLRRNSGRTIFRYDQRFNISLAKLVEKFRCPVYFFIVKSKINLFLI